MSMTIKKLVKDYCKSQNIKLENSDDVENALEELLDNHIGEIVFNVGEFKMKKD
jgi:hypothetical protein